MVYALVTLIVLILVASVALSQRQPPPPSIAEFAPQAVDQITDSPDDLANGKGSATPPPGGETDGSAATPSPGPDVVVARVRHCVGDPPRQIEDPQSPPCVPYWAGDNGGATSKGVTTSQVNIFVPIAAAPGFVTRMEAFFNKRFEFYGRRLKLIEDTTRSTQRNDAAADAVAADEEFRSFASLFSTAQWSYNYGRELARRKIIIGVGEATLTDAFMRKSRPYIWQYQMGLDSMLPQYAKWVCNRVANAPVAHSRSNRGLPRKLGIIYSEPTDMPLGIESLQAGLRACGQSDVPKVQGSTDTAAATNAILQLQQAGVTTILCNCRNNILGTMSQVATTQAYFPEWTMTTNGWTDTSSTMKTQGMMAGQRDALFGVSVEPRQVTPDNSPVLWAEREVDPGYGYAGSVVFGHETVLYHSMLLIASGIQMAGPKLTPASFERGLQTTKFPNPDHPIKAGKVGFESSTYSMTKDASEWWWSESSPPPYTDEGNGTMCYINGGARVSVNAMPTDKDPFFTGACDSGA